MSDTTPVITSLTPNHILVNNGDFICTITGKNFTPDSKVRWNVTTLNPEPVLTTSTTQLKVRIPASLLKRAGLVKVSVFNQPDAPSNTLLFVVTAREDLVIVSAATMHPGAMAKESIARASGTNLASKTEEAPSCDTRQELAQRKVVILQGGDQFQANLFRVSPGEIRFQIPPETAVGNAFVTVVELNGEPVNFGTMEVTEVAPGLFTEDETGEVDRLAHGEALRHISGSQHPQQIANSKTNDPVPIDLNVKGLEKVIITLFGTGIRNHTSVNARINGHATPVVEAGIDSDCVVRDIVRLKIEGDLIKQLKGVGPARIEFSASGKPANFVTVFFS